MKKLFVITLLSLFALSSRADNDDGIKFFSGSWEEAKEESRKTGKPIFIDFYADWCGPCKWMEKDVFTDDEVGEFFNENFISMQIDAEREELDLVEYIDLDAYPTLVFFDAEGEILLKQVGALDTWELIEKGQHVFDMPGIEKAFEENPDDYETLVQYLPMVDEEEAEELALDYLHSLPKEEWKSAESWEIISTYVSDFRSDVVEFVLENDEEYWENTYDYSTYILETILNKVLRAAINEQDLELMQMAIDIEVRARELDDMLEYPAGYYALETQYIYYQYTEDYDTYFAKLTELVETYLWEDGTALGEQAIEVADSFYYDEAYMDTAISWALRGVEVDGDWYSQFVASYCYYMVDDYEKALEHANESKKLIDDESIEEELDGYIAQIEAEI